MLNGQGSQSPAIRQPEFHQVTRIAQHAQAGVVHLEDNKQQNQQRAQCSFACGSGGTTGCVSVVMVDEVGVNACGDSYASTYSAAFAHVDVSKLLHGLHDHFQALHIHTYQQQQQQWLQPVSPHNHILNLTLHTRLHIPRQRFAGTESREA